MKRKLIWGLGGLVVLIVVAVVAILFLFKSTGSASVEDAVADFQADASFAAAPAAGAPAPGVYVYTVTGDESVGRDQLGISRSVTGEAPFIVKTIDGGYETELRYSSDHTEWVRYAVGADGASATWGQSEVKALGIGEVRPREWSPPPLRIPSDLTVGSTWSGTYKSGTLDIAIDAEVLREDVVDVDGVQVPVVVVEAVQAIDGEYSGPRTEEFWVDPATNLVVRYVISSSLEGPIDFSIDAEHTLTTLTPQL